MPRVAHRKHVEAAQEKDEKHFRRPHADASDLRQLPRHFVVVQRGKYCQLQVPVGGLAGQILERRLLLTRQPQAAQVSSGVARMPSGVSTPESNNDSSRSVMVLAARPLNCWEMIARHKRDKRVGIAWRQGARATTHHQDLPAPGSAARRWATAVS